MIKILDTLYGQKTWVSYMLHMETHAVKLPAHSFCADVNVYAISLIARWPHSVTLCGRELRG